MGGPRVGKDSLRLEVCGALDELDAYLGMARCETLPEGVAQLLEQIQRRMIDLRAELVDVTPTGITFRVVDASEVEAFERAIDRYDADLPPLHAFIVLGGTRGSAVLHVARTVCRRAERRLVTLARTEPQVVSPAMMTYINRLSDLLFVLARAANQ